MRAKPTHGGRLRAAAEKYGIPLAEWLDLSTGINPNPWPVPPAPAESWARLPEPEDGPEEAARAYYRARDLLPVAGSQAAIQALPHLRPRGRVGVLTPAYAEHAHAWARTGHGVVEVAPEAIDLALPGLDTLVVVNPNNPTGHRFEQERLLNWHGRLAARGGWLVVDEAFIDPTPEESLAGEAHRPGLIVLRSLGKFFGLAGARVGFVLAHPGLLDRLDDLLGPWTVSGPAREVAAQALDDTSWQERTRRRLAQAGQRLHDLLDRHGLTPTGGTALFQWVQTEQAGAVQDALARRGILVRRFDDPASLRFGHSRLPVSRDTCASLRFGHSRLPVSRDTCASLRFGLPGSEDEWERLARALSAPALRNSVLSNKAFSLLDLNP